MKSKSVDAHYDGNRVCGVCGDKALGCNFNAVSCESCKAFFRRSALQLHPLQCAFNNACDVTVLTRRFCPKCRLDKCFAIGMRKDLIMSEEQKVVKRRKVEENRARSTVGRSFAKFATRTTVVRKSSKRNCMPKGHRRQQLHTTTSSFQKQSSVLVQHPEPVEEAHADFADDKSSLTLLSSTGDESIIQSMLDGAGKSNRNAQQQSTDVNSIATRNMEMMETCCGNCNVGKDGNCCTGNDVKETPGRNAGISTPPNRGSNDITRDVVEDVHRLPIEANSIESILCEAIKLEYQAYSSIHQFNSTSRELNDAERAKLNELIVANKALVAPIDEELVNLMNSDEKFQDKPPEQVLETDPALIDVINLTALVIRRLIKMAKKINAFKNMCQEDQVALLKGGCIEIMVLRSAMNYDPNKQTWKIPYSQEFNLNVDILKLAKGNIYQEHERFINTFDPRWRADENIILILCAITLFTHDRPRVVHRDVIKLEQNSYYYLLRRYLESVYAGCEAKSTFLKLIQKISELRKLNEELVNVYLNVNPAQVEPLLIEIFDLKR